MTAAALDLEEVFGTFFFPFFPPFSPVLDLWTRVTGWKKKRMVFNDVFFSRPARRMFPAMRVKIAGLDPHQQYYIAMDIVPVDNKRYR